MSPITVKALTTVKTAFFNIYRFEKVFGTIESFYEDYYNMISVGKEKEYQAKYSFNDLPG